MSSGYIFDTAQDSSNSNPSRVRESLLIDSRQLGSLLSMSPRSAAAFCKAHGLHPINVGHGAVPRWRWSLEDVNALLVALSSTNQQQASRSTTSSVLDVVEDLASA